MKKNGRMASIFTCLSQRLISKYSSVGIAFCVQVSQCSPLFRHSTRLQHILHQPLCSNSEKRPCEGFLEPNPVPDQNRCCSHVRERNQLHPATTNSTVNPALLVFTDLTPRSSVSLGESISLQGSDTLLALFSFH